MCVALRPWRTALIVTLLKGSDLERHIPDGKGACGKYGKLEDILESQKTQQKIVAYRKDCPAPSRSHFKKVDSSLGISVLSAQVEAENMTLQDIWIDCAKLKSGVILLGSPITGKCSLSQR